MFVESAALGYESAQVRINYTFIFSVSLSDTRECFLCTTQANAAYILSRVFCPSPLPIARGVTDEAEAEGGSFSEAPRSGHTASVDAVTQGVENSRPLVDTEASPIRVPVSGNSATTTGDKAGRVNQEACEVRALALYGLSAGMGNGGSYLKVCGERVNYYCEFQTTQSLHAVSTRSATFTITARLALSKTKQRLPDTTR